MEVTVIGAGLAGSECAWQLAQRGVHVTLREMKPTKRTPAHLTDDFAELCCSNSLRSDQLENAVGLLKEELRRLGSLIMACADGTRVEAGGALAVDRHGFAAMVTEKIRSHPNITVVPGEVTDIPEGEVVIASGPLTSDALAERLQTLLGQDSDLHFYDAAAPLVSAESVDMDKAWFGSRYDKGGQDYVNCPMNQEEYDAFWQALTTAQEAEVHGFEDSQVFEGCMPVEVADDPAMAFKVKKDSSLTVGLELLRDGAGDAFVSAGSTGALLAGATLLVKRIRGIRRAAMGPSIPVRGGYVTLCDCGANAQCTAEYLLQFAFLGSFYAQKVRGIQNPRVALLNIGAEEEKGDDLRHEAYALLQEAGRQGRIHFIGNIEANDAILGGADVLVADGYSGNIMLKTLEGTAKFLMGELKEAFLSGAKTKLAAGLMKDQIRELKRRADPDEIGGTPFLGISKPVIKAHGGSDAKAIANAILRAREYAESGFIADIQANIDYMRVQRVEKV